MLSDSQLQKIMPALPAANRDTYLPYLNAIMPLYGIDSPARMAAFLAQIAHESGQLRYWEEIWGPSAAQKRYEPPSDLATRLGNTKPGDGKRYKGRGPIQLTGRSNYRTYGRLLGYDLENKPELAATVQIGLQIAGQYWKSNGLNELADVQDFLTITQRINGGTNGLADREKFYAVAKQVLGVGAPRPVTRSTTRGVMAFAAAAPVSDEAPPESLPRGHEAINELIGDAPTGGSPEPAAKKKSAPGVAKKAVQVVAVKKAAKKPVKKAIQKAVKKAVVPAKKAAKKLPAKPAKKAASRPVKKAAKKA